MKEMSTIMLTLGTGVWGGHTAEHTITYTNEQIRKAFYNNGYGGMKTATASARIVDNTHIEIIATGTRNQIQRILVYVARSPITIDEVHFDGVQMYDSKTPWLRKLLNAPR